MAITAVGCEIKCWEDELCCAEQNNIVHRSSHFIDFYRESSDDVLLCCFFNDLCFQVTEGRCGCEERNIHSTYSLFKVNSQFSNLHT